MPPRTVKAALANTLQDLGSDDLERFREAVLDRREEPRVRRGTLENKSPVQIADILVSIFTETKIRDVVLEVLADIDLNQQRENFERNDNKHNIFLGYGNIMLVETTGASMQTAQQDNLNYDGVRASYAMAETDLMDMNNFKTRIQNVAQQKGIDAALIAALISRSCRAGRTLVGGRGCYNEQRKAYDTYGLMQIDVNPHGGGHTPRGSWDSEEHLAQALDILIYFIVQIKHAFPDWSKEEQLKGGIAAYNSGNLNVHDKNVDAKTANGDYSNDVVARAQWYKSDGGF
ncbi:uncharacterized protein V6R79_009646 [Siganus canaliculatus]